MMRSVRPIPRGALPDVMTVRLELPDGTFGEPVIVANVRFEETQSMADDAHRSADAGAGKVFVDAVNSIGAFDIPAGSRVAIRGRCFIARSVHRCEDLFGRCHHWEIEVG